MTWLLGLLVYIEPYCPPPYEWCEYATLPEAGVDAASLQSLSVLALHTV